MNSMKILLICVFNFMAFFQMNAQSFRVEKVEWVDSLRTYLAIDSSYCLDSIVSFRANNNEFSISISRKRPDLEKALFLLDSLFWHLDNDTTYARLVTILHEFDIKYQSEFVYTLDYFQSIYHRDVREARSKRINEFTFINEMERALQAKKLLRDSSISIIELLGAKNKNYWLEIENPVSTTWVRFGAIEISFYKRIYNKIYKTYENELKDFLTREMSVNEYYRICYVFNLFNRTDPSKINCERIESLINENTSKNFITALKNVNTKFHENSCLNDLLKNY